MNIIYTKHAERQLHKLPPDIRDCIVRKMRWFRLQNDPLSFADHLTNPKEGEYRFRVGDYRVICDIKRGTVRVLIVLAIRRRDHAYDDM